LSYCAWIWSARLRDVSLLAAALDDRRVVLGHHDLLGPAELGEFDIIEERPRSSLKNVPPVSTAMSPSMALRRSPKPGAFTARP
jgi:hypothetical protein